MSLTAIIGGSGFAALPELDVRCEERPDTPYGPTSAPIMRGLFGGCEILFLPRHGPDHSVPPHRIEYRANVWALHACGAKRVVGLGAVGGIGRSFGPGVLAVPDQIVDYTHGRAHSFNDGGQGKVVHIDFTRPYCEELRRTLRDAAREARLDFVDGGTYGVMQGPRLETAAEIVRLERDGCDMVGMTGMPETALAKELGLCYACLAFVVNWAAGKAPGEIRMEELEANITACSAKIGRILLALTEIS